MAKLNEAISNSKLGKNLVFELRKKNAVSTNAVAPLHLCVRLKMRKRKSLPLDSF